MLYEWEGIRQRPEEGVRTWYTDEDMDLIVWRSADDGQVSGFQLCYDKARDEKAVSWYAGGSVSHRRIDEGESKPGAFKSSPVLADEVALDAAGLARNFRDRAEKIDSTVRDLVLQVLRDQSDRGSS